MGGGVKFAHPTRHVQRLAWHARQKERAADGGTERWEPLTQWLARA
jgi:hypothetical protein